MDNTKEQEVETVEVEDKGPLSGFEEFSVEETEETTEAEMPTAEEKIEEAEKPQEETEEVEDSEKTEEVKETEEKEEAPKTEEDSFEFKAPEETDETETTEAETWKNIGEDLDLKVEGDDFEDFKKAYAERIEQIKEDAHNQAMEEAPTLPENITEETKNLINLAKEGIDLKEYLDPINTIDGWLKYDDKTLVKEDLESKTNGSDERLYTDEQVTEKLERYEDNEFLKDKADDIREQLIAEKHNITEEVIEEQNYRAEQAKIQQDQAVQAQATHFINTVKSTEEFMGGKIGEDVKSHVTNMWNNGQVHELFNDPKKIVDFVLYHTVGDQVMQQRDNQAFSNGQSKAKKSLHNIPPVTTSGSTNRGVDETPTDEAGDFTAWETAMKNLRAE